MKTAYTIAACLLAGAASADWTYRESTDAFSDERYVSATNALVQTEDKLRHHSIVVSCKPSTEPVYPRIPARIGIFIAFGYLVLEPGASVQYRFDDEPAGTFIDAESKSDALFTREGAPFAKKLQQHSRLRLALPLFIHGRHVVEIDLTGSSEPIGKVLAECGVPA